MMKRVLEKFIRDEKGLAVVTYLIDLGLFGVAVILALYAVGVDPGDIGEIIADLFYATV